jgi:cell wall-associated NlpC family hydrolase
VPWPPTGAFDPVIDLSDQLAASTTPGVESDENMVPQMSTFMDPQTNMIAFGLTNPVDPNFSALPAPDEVRFKDVSEDKKRQAVIDFAKTKLGIPYVWGGTTDRGYDCSGLVMKAFGSAGISMPRISWAQAAKGQRVKISDLQPGDLVAWDHQSGDGGPDHIAIYIGNGQIIEAPHTGANVRIRKLGKNEGAMGVHLSY